MNFLLIFNEEKIQTNALKQKSLFLHLCLNPEGLPKRIDIFLIF